jgi:uroporphyrinogen-III synthase
MKIKRILISQPKPELERSPYFEIAKNFGVEVHFRPFVQVEGIPAREFRKNRIDILSYTAVIMTSKNAVDHFFRICSEMRIIVPETMKYFCISETTAYYLQKYIQFRKRKIFYSNLSYADLVELIRKKHKDDKYLLPCSDAPNEEYTTPLEKEGIRFVKAPLYRAVFSDIKDVNFSDYDMVVLFSSAGINSLFNSFPDYKQNDTVIAAFGEQTAKAVTNAGLKFHIVAPQPNSPSMASAMELYLKGEYILSSEPFAPNLLAKKPKPGVIKQPTRPSPPKKVEEKKVEKPMVKPVVAPNPKPVHKPVVKINKPPVAVKPKVIKPAPKHKKPVQQKSKPLVRKKMNSSSPKKKTVPKKVKKSGKGRK